MHEQPIFGRPSLRQRLRGAIVATPVLGDVAPELAKALRRFRKGLPKPETAQRRMRGGYSLLLHPNTDSYERRIFMDGVYEPATLKLFDVVLRPGDAMVDVGANIGVMSLHAVMRVGPNGKVIAVEPHPGHGARLRENIALNGITNIVVAPYAAGARTERRAIFDFPDANIGRSSLVDPGQGALEAGAIEVRTLDDILAAHNVGAVRLVKIDVEGFESEALAGASRLLAKQPVLCIEIAPTLPTENGDPYAAHAIVMATGFYESFRFRDSKFAASPLVPLPDPRALEHDVDNVVYIPRRLRADLPQSLFA